MKCLELDNKNIGKITTPELLDLHTEVLRTYELTGRELINRGCKTKKIRKSFFNRLAKNKFLKTVVFSVGIGSGIGLGTQIWTADHEAIQNFINSKVGEVETNQSIQNGTKVTQKIYVHYSKDQIKQVAKFISSDITIPTSGDLIFEMENIPQFLNLRKLIATRGITIDNMNSKVLTGFDFTSAFESDNFLCIDGNKVVITPPALTIEYVFPVLQSLDKKIVDKDSLLKDVDSKDTIIAIEALSDKAKDEVLTDKDKQNILLTQATNNLISLFQLAYPDKQVVVNNLQFSSENAEK